MKIDAISSQNFQSKNFRLPVKTEIVRHDNIVNEKRVIVKEYSNPRAEYWWGKALEESDSTKKIKYLNLMGGYKLIDINQAEVIANAKRQLKL